MDLNQYAEGPTGPWRVANDGGSRGRRLFYFVTTDYSGHRPFPERYHEGPSGKLITFKTRESAQRRADKLNDGTYRPHQG